MYVIFTFDKSTLSNIIFILGSNLFGIVIDVILLQYSKV